MRARRSWRRLCGWQRAQSRAPLGDRLDWQVDGLDWPNRVSSRFISAAGLLWHVQEFSTARRDAPVILLLHGTASEMPMPPSGQSLTGMAQRVAALMKQMQLSPDLIVGHSAGAAVAARMVLDGSVQPAALVSLNGAFIRFGGMAGAIFSPLARLMATGSLTAKFFAWQANDPVVIQRLMRSTGSVIDATGMRLYQRLMQSPAHVRAALAMMAHWDLYALERDLPNLSIPVWLVAAENDLTVPPQQAAVVAKRLPQAQRVLWPMLGHLAHEESPSQCVDLLVDVINSIRTG
ncbi:MAG: alpha/beta fold hydrolase [Betaproteobacteria bacterium]|nr:alpha/beta fold hydrolase [Betaproteobacteria bacterium]